MGFFKSQRLWPRPKRTLALGNDIRDVLPGLLKSSIGFAVKNCDIQQPSYEAAPVMVENKHVADASSQAKMVAPHSRGTDVRDTAAPEGSPMKATPADSILVIATRRIGDVLLTTPLLRSLRRGYPHARIDALIHESTAGILRGNPDIDRVIAVPEQPTLAQYRTLAGTILRRYDIAVSTQTGDRPIAYALLSGRVRIGPVLSAGSRGAWKRHLLTASTPFDDLNTHTVVQNLRLADLLGIARTYTVVAPTVSDPAALDRTVPFAWRDERFAVLHPAPMFHYKRWHADGWRELVGHLIATGLRVVITGGPGPAELAYIARTLGDRRCGAIDLAGRLSLAELAALLCNASLYVGPDTAITHLAAATGTPTVALYGPTNPVKWGPWPAGYEADRSPFRRLDPRQEVNNVALLQGLGDCVPCHQEGCDRHLESRARCLDEMPASRVIAASDWMLERHAR